MLKISRFTVVLVLSLAGISISSPSVVIAQSVASLDIDQPVCYMQTAEGEVLNLDRLCNNRSAPQRQIVIADSFQEDGYLIGTVVNRSDRAVRNVLVNYEVRDIRGNVVERSSTPIETSTLNPGETAMFETITETEGQVRAVSVNWNE